MLYGDATNSFGRLPKNAIKSRYLSNQGGLDNSPKWDLIDLAFGVTGVLPPLNGGAGANAQVISAPTGIAVTIDLALGNFCTMSVASATGNLTLTFLNPAAGLLNYLCDPRLDGADPISHPRQPLWGGSLRETVGRSRPISLLLSIPVRSTTFSGYRRMFFKG
jgi:hypothetical protein